MSDFNLDAARKLAGEPLPVESEMRTMLRAACDEIETLRKDREAALAACIQAERGDWTHKDERDTLARENERLRKALTFYASEGNWKPLDFDDSGTRESYAEEDEGKKARAALTKES